MSFQITILKELAGHPEGRASLADLKHAMAILISSGSDWTDRTKRLAARAPDLDIFSQSATRAGGDIDHTARLVKSKTGSSVHAKQDNAEYCYCQEGHRGEFVVFLLSHLCRIARGSRVRLGVTKEYEGAVSEGLPHDRKMASSEPASVSLAP